MNGTKRMLNLVVACMSVLFISSVEAWESDNGDGTFSNPVLYADYPDPDIIRVGTSFYMVSTTFADSPGLVVLRSPDLVNWEIISHAASTLDMGGYELAAGATKYRQGMWASSIRYHDGTFYIVVSPVGANARIYYATDPEGPWSYHQLDRGAYDPGFFIDDDGTGYIFCNNSPQSVITLNAGFSAVVSQVDNVVTSGGEGSHVVKRGSYYYLFNANPGTWPFQLRCSRATNIFGPWETGHICLTATTGGHQGAIVDVNDSDEWFGFVHQDSGAVGRMPRIGPVFWENDWPVFGTPSNRDVMADTYAKPVPGQLLAQPETDDDFTAATLGLQWQWNHNPDNTRWSLSERTGYLRLRPMQASSFWTARNTLTQKGQGPKSSGVVKLDISSMQPGDVAGFGTLGSVNGHIYVTAGADGSKTLGMVVDDRAVGSNTYAAHVPFAGDTLYLRTDLDFVSNEGSCSYSADGTAWTRLGGDFPLKFDITTGTFQGEKFALFCYNPDTESSTGYIDVDSFDFSDSFEPVSLQRGRPRLNTARTTFVADNGQPLRGPFASTEWSGPPSLSAVQAVREQGCNAIHLYAEVFDPAYTTGGGGTAPGYSAANIDALVNMTRDEGLYLIMTIGNGGNNGDHNYDYAIDFWEFYAPRYAEETHVIYEMHNEPMAWGPSYLTGTTPANTMAMEIDAFNTIRAHAPDTPVLLFSYAVIGGSSGYNNALTDIQYFNQQVFGSPDAVWTNEAVGFHGYAGWEGTSEAIESLIVEGYPCFMTEFVAAPWGEEADTLDVELTSELERLGVSWLSFLRINGSIAPDFFDPASFYDRVEASGLSWVPDYGTWPARRGPYGNGGQPRETSGLSGALRIQAEDFDVGGEGVAYQDDDASNNGGAYRTGESVDIESTTDTGGGYCIGWTAAGEWLEYTIWVTEPGFYNLRLRHAGLADAEVEVICNGEDKTGSWTLPATGGWQTWATASSQVFLEFGRQKLRLSIAEGAPNLNWIELVPVAAGAMANGTYKIVNRNSGLVADADVSNNLLEQYPYTGATDQRWNLVHRGAGQYSIGSAASSSRFWSTFYNGNGDSVNLNTWGYDGSADRRYIVRPNEDGSQTILVVDGGLSVETAGASISGGADIQQYEYAGLPHQQWAIVSPSAPGIPTALTATGISDSQIDLSWNAVSGATSYSLKRSAANGPYITLAGGLAGTSYSDTDVDLGITYTYIVIAYSGTTEGPPSAPASATPFGILPGIPSPVAEELYNINMAGQESDPGTVPTGTVIMAPSLTAGSDLWNNLTCANWWDFTGPRTITGADGSSTITVNWSGESGHHLIRWNSGSYYGLYQAMFGEPGETWDLTMSFSGLDADASYDIYWYSTWPESENPLTNTVTVGTCNEPVKVMYPEQDYVNGATDYSMLVEDVNYHILTDITPAGSGVITVRSRGQNVSVAGIQVVKRPAGLLAPTGLTAARISSSQIDLSWNTSSGASAYNVKRATVSGGPYITIASNVVSTSYSDTGIPSGTTTYYVVSALGESGESPDSVEVHVPELHAYLRFNEASGTAASDATGHGWNGTLIGGASWGSGRFGNAVSLDGSDDYVSLPDGVVAGLGGCTIAAWVNLDTVSNWARIFDFGTGTTAYMFLTPQNSINGNVRFAITTGGAGGEQTIDGSGPLPTGGWTHVAVTLNGSSGTLYVNGSPVGTGNVTLTPSSLGSTTQNWIGRSQYSADAYIDGRVDDFRVYDSALGANEVAALYALDIPATPAAPAGLTAVPVSAAQIDLSWAASAGADSYNVKRSTVSGESYVLIASNIVAQGYSDTVGLTGGVRYYYVVSAANIAGGSPDSDEADAVPSPEIGADEYVISSHAIVEGVGISLTVSSSVPGHDYTPLATDDLLLPDWQPAWTAIPGTGLDLQFSIPISEASSNRYFKLDVQRQ